MLTVSFIGVGNRGGVYAKNFAINPNVKIISACDINGKNLKPFVEEYGVDEKNVFTSEEEFFKEKRSNVLVIATMDQLHCAQAVKALSLGYDVLLEKPVAPTLEEFEEIVAAAEKYERSVVICHNLRHTPFYQGIKEVIVKGEIGEIVSVEQAENVSFIHYISSFVRGNWHRKEDTSSIILQKCCHDLDIINWLIGKKCEELTSFGGLYFYCQNGAPPVSAKRCADCKNTVCTYNGINLYTKYPEILSVPYGFDYSKENVERYIKQENVGYGACVFDYDNDVCDRQVVNMRFEGGVTANLLMQGFTAPVTDRVTAVYGTKGVIEGTFNSGKFTVSVFGKEPYEVDVNKVIVGKNSHNGGDAKLVRDYVEYMTGESKPLGISLIYDSLYSHKLAFTAEDSRLLGGAGLTVER